MELGKERRCCLAKGQTQHGDVLEELRFRLTSGSLIKRSLEKEMCPSLQCHKSEEESLCVTEALRS